MSEKCLLTNGMEPKEASELIHGIKESERVFKKIEEIINKELTKDFSQDFESPSWAYKQAFEIGYKKGLQKLLEYVRIYP